jgi:hypothetical protein
MGQPRTIVDAKPGARAMALWLLLLSIFTHAVLPAGSPVQGRPGSAFSASTADVSLAPTRRSLAGDQFQLGTADDESSKGSAPPDPAILSGAFTAAPAGQAAPAPEFPPEAPAAPGDGGAASFEARAPPSI